jgi:hypothetical protein
VKLNYFKATVILLGFGLTYLGNACGPEGGGLNIGLAKRSSSSIGGGTDSSDLSDGTPTSELTAGSTGPTPQEVSVRSEAVCETEGDWSSYLDNWISSHGTTNCFRSKSCQNCCGDSNRFDRFQAKCFTPQPMDASTLGARSFTVCEDIGQSYLLGFAAAKKSVGINCSTVKAQMNGCGAGGGMDTFYVQCER